MQLIKLLYMLDTKMLKKDQMDILKPHEVNDDELLQVHTKEYVSSLKVSFISYPFHNYTHTVNDKTFTICWVDS